jgi:hypothetical protein
MTWTAFMIVCQFLPGSANCVNARVTSIPTEQACRDYVNDSMNHFSPAYMFVGWCEEGKGLKT